MNPRSFRILSDFALACGALVGLAAGIEAAVVTEGDLVWMWFLLLPPLLVWTMLVPVRLWYGRRVRARLLRDAHSAVLTGELPAALHRIDEAEEWLGKLGMDDERSELRSQLQNGRPTV